MKANLRDFSLAHYRRWVKLIECSKTLKNSWKKKKPHCHNGFLRTLPPNLKLCFSIPFDKSTGLSIDCWKIAAVIAGNVSDLWITSILVSVICRL